MSKLKETVHFFAAYLIPYFCVILMLIDKGLNKALVVTLVMIPVGLLGGIKLLLFSVSEIHSFNFTLFLFAIALTSIAFFIYGLMHRKKFWGKLINAVAFYVFCFAGFIALSPSA